MTADYRTGKWAQLILAQQQPDGLLPGMFHSMAVPRGTMLTTEQALRRLHALGFTRDDEPIRRALTTMSACLRGERKIDAYYERGIDWAMYEMLMLAAWVRRFDPNNEAALDWGRRWAGVAEAAFAAGSLDSAVWNAAYEDTFRRRAHHPQPISLTPFYHGMLLPNLLTQKAERALVRHILHSPGGMYYVYEQPLTEPPFPFEGRETSRWLAALEMLAAFPHARDELDFAASWLRMHQQPDGSWDLGRDARDQVHFPLSDSWRREAIRRADCTWRIEQLLTRIEPPD